MNLHKFSQELARFSKKFRTNIKQYWWHGTEVNPYISRIFTSQINTVCQIALMFWYWKSNTDCHIEVKFWGPVGCFKASNTFVAEYNFGAGHDHHIRLSSSVTFVISRLHGDKLIFTKSLFQPKTHILILFVNLSQYANPIMVLLHVRFFHLRFLITKPFYTANWSPIYS